MDLGLAIALGMITGGCIKAYDDDTRDWSCITLALSLLALLCYVMDFEFMSLCFLSSVIYIFYKLYKSGKKDRRKKIIQ